MPIDIFTNAATAALSANVTTTPAAGTAELWTVNATGSFPQIGTAEVFQFRATVNLLTDASPEIVIVQQINSATTMTVLRGAEGSPIKTHAVGDTVSLSITAGTLAALIPPGKLEMYAGGTPPIGWLLCDGSAVSRTTFANLFAAIGTTWGPGDGSTTFNVPDLRGRSPIGAGTGTGLTNRTLGAQVGAETHVMALSEMPSHGHNDTGHYHTDSGHSHSGGTGNQSSNHAHGSSAGSGFAFTGQGTWGSVSGGQPTVGGPNLKTAGVDADHSHSFNTNGASASIGSGSAQNQPVGGGNAHTIVHPCAVINYIIRT
jgi:microcystin-dependent protein